MVNLAVYELEFWNEFFPQFSSSVVRQVLQGPSWQSEYFEMALVGRDMQVRFCLKIVFESGEWIFLGIATSICEMLTVGPLLDQMETTLSSIWFDFA